MLTKNDKSKLIGLLTDKVNTGDTYESVVTGIRTILKNAGYLFSGDKTDIADLTESLADKLFDENVVSGMATTWPEFDYVIGGGLKATHLYILGADTGMGKSIFALNILVNLAKKGVKVCYFDLENGEEESVHRLLRIWHQLPHSFFSDPTNKADLYFMSRELQGKIAYYSTENFNRLAEGDRVEYIVAEIERLSDHRRGGDYKVFLIDPLQALDIEKKDSQMSFVSAGKTVEALKNVAQRCRVPIIVLHHLRKVSAIRSSFVTDVNEETESKYRVPLLEDFKGTSRITDFATDVLGLVRQKDDSNLENQRISTVRALKVRGVGDTGKRVQFVFDSNTLSFTPLTANKIFTGEI